MNIEDVFDWIGRRRRTGTLSVELGETSHSFNISSGNINATSSNVPGERLGQLLVSHGLISERELTAACQLQTGTSVQLGQLLLASGQIQKAELKNILEDKIREAVWDVLSWDGGHFSFETAVAPKSTFPIELPLNITVELGKIQAARWREIRQQLPSANLRFWTANRDRLPNNKPKNTLAFVEILLKYVDAGLTIQQMILQENGRRFSVMSQLADLVSQNVLAIDRRESRRNSTGHPIAELEEAARALADEGRKQQALALTTRALTRDPERQSLREFHKELQRSLFAELSRELLCSNRIPTLLLAKEEIAKMELSDNERYLVGRIDGHWDLLSLLQISPIREVDALLSFKQLQERGIVDL